VKRRLVVGTRTWALREPFVIARSSQATSDVAVVHLEEGGRIARGEAVGVDYHGESPETIRAQIEAVRREIESGIDRRGLLDLLPAGGARNAIDAALWDLEAKRAGVRAWQLAGLESVRPIATTYTIGIRSIAEYEATARTFSAYEWLKIKVDEHRPLEAVLAVRAGAPRSKLVVDANQAWTVAQLIELAPRLHELGVALLEQPVPGDDDAALANLDLPVPLCADEPVNTAADLARIAGRYDFVNIKLDKSGGLTAALELAHASRETGLRLMVGCMVGGSLAMAPAFVVAQLCEIADLDGPLLQSEDWPDAIEYRDGVMSPPSPKLWG
jgi:L-Ala-D/L-Glu epimerase